MNLFLIFLLGTGVLVGALGLNVLASVLGLSNWYDFLKHPSQTSTLSYMWLFILYPFGLGIAAYLVAKLLALF